MKKETTDILDNKRMRNGGMHKQPAYRNIKAMLYGHDFTAPRLFHIVMMIAQSGNDYESAPGPVQVGQFKKALRALCVKLTEAGIGYRWRACVEHDASKGWHLHTFLLVDNDAVNPCSIIQPRRIYGEWSMRQMMENHSVSFHIASPMADMHKVGGLPNGKQQNYAYIGTPEKLADCLEWVSYLVKKRSKPTDTKQIYFSSRDTIIKAKGALRATSKARTFDDAISAQSAIVIEQDAPRAAILDAIEIEASIDAISAPAFFLEPDAIAIEIDPAIATSIERPAAAAIDPRQCDLFNQPAIVLGDSDQPAPTAGKPGRRVSDERRSIVMAILLDPERGQWSDRAISRETGVSAPIIRAMRATLTSNDGQIRTFQKGGKIYTMNAAAIGKRPPAPPTTQG
jgi:hypothetical protein